MSLREMYSTDTSRRIDDTDWHRILAMDTGKR